MSWKDIPGRTAYLWIYDEWLKATPREGAVVVEVGVALGKSIAYLAEELAVRGRGDIVVYAVDAWGGYAQNGEQQTMAKDAGGDFSLYAKTMLAHAPAAFERVRPIRAPSVEAASFFRHRSVDLVVLDAAHDYDSVRADIDAWLCRVVLGGWIGGDDHHAKEYPGVVRACRETFPGGYETRNEHNWPTWLKRL